MELTLEDIRNLQKDAIKLAVVAEYLSDQSMPAMAHTVDEIVVNLKHILGADNYIV